MNKMSTTFTDIVAAKKLTSIKKNYKLSAESEDVNSPETQKKLCKKIEKDQERAKKYKQKREEAHEERDQQREKLRNRVRAKYNLGDEEQQRIGQKKNKKKGDLKEKDFYKYNKAMPQESEKLSKENETDDSGVVNNFTERTEQLSNKKKDNCIIA